MPKVLLDYDPMTGNVNVGGITSYVGYNLPEYIEPTPANIPAHEPAAVRLAQMGFTSEQLIALRKAGVL